MAALLGMALAVFPAVAGATEYRVTTGYDTFPGACTQTDCTLREAILAANAAPGEDIVLLRPDIVYALTVPGAGENTGARGDLDVTGPLQLVATGRGRATIDAFGTDRVLDLYAPATVEGLRVTGGETEPGVDSAGAGVRVVSGRFALRDTAIVENHGTSALELVGDDGMTARDSLVTANLGSGIVDRGGGGLRAAHTKVSGNQGNGIEGHGGGSLALFHGEVNDNSLRGVHEVDGGDVAAVDMRLSANGKQAIDEGGDGSIYVRRSRLRRNGADALTEEGDGEVSVYRTKLTGSRGGAAVELGPGSISFIKARIAFNDGLALSEADKGSVGLEETLLIGSPLGGAVERGEGGVILTLAEVVDSGGVGIAEHDEGDVSLVRAAVRGAGGDALAATGAVSLLRARIAANGGGVAVTGGALGLGRSQIVGNAGATPGILATDSAVTLRQSTVGANVPAGGVGGGGIALLGASTLDAVNATVAENSAIGPGAGILAGAGAEVHLNAVTVVANSTAADAGGGISLEPGATASLDNSLVARNESASTAPDCAGTGFVSGGGNLLGSVSGCAAFSGATDLVRPDPRVGRLGRNGGPTQTVALRRGSPAIGAAEGDAPRRDQRNLARRDPDAGAFERR